MVASSDGMANGRIFMVGFMGAGKSTVGSLLAESLGWEFVDLDYEIERQQGRTIRELFEAGGEAYFRRIETETLNQLKFKFNVVVALGGGAFIPEANRATIAELGISVFLDCPLSTILARCAGDGTRPLLQSPEQVKELYDARHPLYCRSDICIDVSEMTPDQITKSILERIAEG
jgi:shikimate kinase